MGGGPLSASWFLMSLRGGLKFKLPWTEKSTVFPENSERDYLAPQLLFPLKPSGSLSRTHRSEANPHCKNGITNSFNREAEGRQRMCCSPLGCWAGSELLFHRSWQKMVFPWAVACSQVHVFLAVMSAVRRAKGINRSPINHSHRCLLLSGVPGRKVVKKRCECGCWCVSCNRWTPLLTMAFEQLKVADDEMVCSSHREYTLPLCLACLFIFVRLFLL